MIIDPTDVLEVVMLSAKKSLQENHARLVDSLSEFEALEGGHALTHTRRAELIATLERWDEERLWFTVDGRGGIPLEDVCDAAGTTVGIVRAFYQDWLIVPFNYKKAYSSLIWETNLAREDCGRCAGGRCEVPQARVHDEGRTAR